MKSVVNRWHRLFLLRFVFLSTGIEGLDPLRHYAFVGEISGLMERDVDVVVLEECGVESRIKWTIFF